MSQVTIIASPSAPHQVAHAQAMLKGLARIGVDAEIVSRSFSASTPIVACWGWRIGQSLRAAGKDVLVMERGYIGDRFAWTSLGWNGLNGRAVMPELDDGGARFRRYHSPLLASRDYSRNEYVLLVGQVPGDAALAGKDLSSWYRDTLHKSEHIYQMPARFRPHPRARPNVYPKDIKQYNGDLSEAIAGARAVITYNSNTAVEAVLAGKPALAFDEGSMAWNVTSHMLGDDYNGDRLNWAHRLAWKQWQLKEIEDGTALSHLWRLL